MYMIKSNNKKRLIKNNTDKNKKRLCKNLKNIIKTNKLKKDQYNILFKYYYNNHIIENYKIYNKFFNKEIIKSRNYYKNLIN